MWWIVHSSWMAIQHTYLLKLFYLLMTLMILRKNLKTNIPKLKTSFKNIPSTIFSKLTCSNSSTLVQISLELSKFVYNCPNWSIPVQIGLCLTKFVYTCPNWSRHVQIGLAFSIFSEIIQNCLQLFKVV